jgi:ABC-type nitrate/sulfonate/bicarbonate transport system permease component
MVSAPTHAPQRTAARTPGTSDPGVVNAAAASVPRLPLRRMVLLALPIVSVVAAVMAWDSAVRLELFSHRLLPSPAEVLAAAQQMYSDGTLAADAAASFRRALHGFVVGSSIAVVIGTLTGRSAIARGLLEPVIQVIRPIPAIALVPLAILWFGIGEESKLFLTSLGVFFPVWVNTHAGIATTRDDYLRVAASLGAPRLLTFTSVVLPGALPFILTGLRQGIATSLVLIVASEQSGVTEGLGFRLDQARLFSQPDRLFVCLAALGVVGALADQLFHQATRHRVRWAKEQS